MIMKQKASSYFLILLGLRLSSNMTDVVCGEMKEYLNVDQRCTVRIQNYPNYQTYNFIDSYDWPLECISFADLAERDIRPYLKHLQVISSAEEDSIIINEKNLIAIRLLQKNVLVDDSMWTCPKHRSSFGIHWYDVASLCSHPDYVSKQRSSTVDRR